MFIPTLLVDPDASEDIPTTLNPPWDRDGLSAAEFKQVFEEDLYCITERDITDLKKRELSIIEERRSSYLKLEGPETQQQVKDAFQKVSEAFEEVPKCGDFAEAVTEILIELTKTVSFTKTSQARENVIQQIKQLKVHVSDNSFALTYLEDFKSQLIEYSYHRNKMPRNPAAYQVLDRTLAERNGEQVRDEAMSVIDELNDEITETWNIIRAMEEHQKYTTGQLHNSRKSWFKNVLQKYAFTALLQVFPDINATGNARMTASLEPGLQDIVAQKIGTALYESSKRWIDVFSITRRVYVRVEPDSCSMDQRSAAQKSAITRHTMAQREIYSMGRYPFDDSQSWKEHPVCLDSSSIFTYVNNHDREVAKGLIPSDNSSERNSILDASFALKVCCYPFTEVEEAGEDMQIAKSPPQGTLTFLQFRSANPGSNLRKTVLCDRRLMGTSSFYRVKDEEWVAVCGDEYRPGPENKRTSEYFGLPLKVIQKEDGTTSWVPEDDQAEDEYDVHGRYVVK